MQLLLALAALAASPSHALDFTECAPNEYSVRSQVLCGDLDLEPLDNKPDDTFSDVSCAKTQHLFAKKCDKKKYRFEDAATVCGFTGMRLCTKYELETDVAFKTGCNMDGQRVWSSSPCGPESSNRFWGVAGSSRNKMKPRCMETDDNPKLKVRCCAGATDNICLPCPPFSTNAGGDKGPDSQNNCECTNGWSDGAGSYGCAAVTTTGPTQAPTTVDFSVCGRFGKRKCRRKKAECTWNPDDAGGNGECEVKTDPPTPSTPAPPPGLECSTNEYAGGSLSGCSAFVGASWEVFDDITNPGGYSVCAGAKTPDGACINGNKKQTLQNAITMCGNANARLCTRGEIKAGAFSSSCGVASASSGVLDRQVWTSNTCGAGYDFATGAAAPKHYLASFLDDSEHGDGDACTVTGPDTTALVMCCADTFGQYCADCPAASTSPFESVGYEGCTCNGEKIMQLNGDVPVCVTDNTLCSAGDYLLSSMQGLTTTCADTRGNIVSDGVTCARSRDAEGRCPVRAETFALAQEMCTSNGMRICSVSELESDAAQGSGCNLDNKLVWSTSPCGADYSGRVAMAGSTFGEQSKQCLFGDSNARVRCCATVAEPTCVACPEGSSSAPSSVGIEQCGCTGIKELGPEGVCVVPTSAPTQMPTIAPCGTDEYQAGSMVSCKEFDWGVKPRPQNANGKGVCGSNKVRYRGQGGSCARNADQLDHEATAGYCESFGARLCTVDEASNPDVLSGEECLNSEGSNWTRSVWTDQACSTDLTLGSESPSFNDGFFVTDVADGNTECRPPSDVAFTACCADNGGRYCEACPAETENTAGGGKVFSDCTCRESSTTGQQNYFSATSDSVCSDFTLAPTATPSEAPSTAPTGAPTAGPTMEPTSTPSSSPTTDAPTTAPSTAPTGAPSVAPTLAPSAEPTGAPTAGPTFVPTAAPSSSPTTQAPTTAMTAEPTAAPTFEPTAAPTEGPTASPSSNPTVVTTIAPTASYEEIVSANTGCVNAGCQELTVGECEAYATANGHDYFAESGLLFKKIPPGCFVSTTTGEPLGVYSNYGDTQTASSFETCSNSKRPCLCKNC